MDTDADCHIAFRHQGSSLCEIICLWMLGIIRGEVAVGGSGHDNSKASVFKQLFKSHCNTQVDILFHDAGGGNLTRITSTMCWLLFTQIVICIPQYIWGVRNVLRLDSLFLQVLTVNA